VVGLKKAVQIKELAITSLGSRLTKLRIWESAKQATVFHQTFTWWRSLISSTVPKMVSE